MPTKVFISWSGDLSRKLAETLRDWLPSTLQYVKPYFTPEDIEKGAKWSSEIAKELETSNIGVICLTRDNTEKPWILFEAGALSKSIEKGRVCTLLFDLEPADVKGPLTNFQGTRFVKEDFKRLVVTINSAAGDARLEPAVLEDVFDMWWPQLETKVRQLLKSHEKEGKKEKRSDRDILEELLELSRLNAKRPIHPHRMSRRALVEIVDALDELGVVASREHGDIVRMILHRIEPPLRHLSMESGIPEISDRLHMIRRHQEHRAAAALAEKAEQGDVAESTGPRG
jgi:hypothetical protein